MKLKPLSKFHRNYQDETTTEMVETIKTDETRTEHVRNAYRKDATLAKGF